MEAELRDFVLGGVALEVCRISWLVAMYFARVRALAEPTAVPLCRFICCDGSPEAEICYMRVPLRLYSRRCVQDGAVQTTHLQGNGS